MSEGCVDSAVSQMLFWEEMWERGRIYVRSAELMVDRTETEAYTSHVADILLGNRLASVVKRQSKPDEKKDVVEKVQSLKILDVCSGSGCISLLLHSLLAQKFSDLTIVGLDISPTAIKLAKQNLSHNIKNGNLRAEAKQQVQFGLCDVLSQHPEGFGNVDVIVSNPPYISGKKFVTETCRSVRNYEPSLALVPRSLRDSKQLLGCEPEDVFYRRLLKIHQLYGSRMLVMEIGDEEQARRVVQMALAGNYPRYNRIEIWRDWPDGNPELGEDTVMWLEGQSRPAGNVDVSRLGLQKKPQIVRSGWGALVDSREVLNPEVEIPIIGTGMIRTVVLFRKRKSGPITGKERSISEKRDEVKSRPEDKCILSPTPRREASVPRTLAKVDARPENKRINIPEMFDGMKSSLRVKHINVPKKLDELKAGPENKHIKDPKTIDELVVALDVKRVKVKG
jgi:HemK-like putative methylase